jgi:hypothetical protein
MKTLTLIALLSAAGQFALAAQAAEFSYFGPVDTSIAPEPGVIYERVVKAAKQKPGDIPQNIRSAKVLYLHVPAGEERHWSAHCAKYQACEKPVLFVSEAWYQNVYLPLAGANNGRDRDYREVATRAEPHPREARKIRCVDGH